jgi:hypothetical protein
MNDSTRKPRREEFRGENHDGSQSETETEDVHMLTQKVTTRDVLQGHPVAKELDHEAQLALVCEYIDLYDELQGMSMSEFIEGYFAAADEGAEAQVDEATSETDPNEDEDDEDEDDEDEPSRNVYDAKIKERPRSMVGMRVVYRFPGQNVLSDANGVTSDSDETVAFTDVEDEVWSNVSRDKVYTIHPDNYREIHVTRREAKEIEGWLAGKPSTTQPEGDLLRNLTVEFADFPDKIVLAIVNGKRPYVDRFVQLPENNFEEDQKPTTRLFGEHCFRVRGKDYIVNAVSP